MRTSDDTWTSIIEAGDFSMETVAVIDGSEYDTISAPVINRSLFTGSPSVGNATAASLQFSVLTSNEISQSAEIVIKSRITDGENYSEWVEAGTFYIDTRSNDTDTGLKTFTCYDAMLKANQRYCADETEDSTVRIGWPKYMTDVVDEIAERIGVELDDRTEIKEGDDYIVTFPDDLTMLQVLQHIGSCHGGNWIITPDNKLRLVPLVGIPTYYILDDDGNYIVSDDDYYLVCDDDTSPDEHPAGGGSLDVEAVLGKVTTGKTLTITGVTITRESAYTYSAGDDSGYVLDCGDAPYACQQIADDLLEDLVGLVYMPFTATKAVYDPCAELGDWVYVGNRVVSVIYTEKATYNTSFRSDISAPSKEETESEYPYLTTLEKANQNTTAYVTKVWEEIELEYTSAITQSATDILATVYGEYSQDVSIIDTVNGILADYVTTSTFEASIEETTEGILLSVSETYATQTSVSDLENNLLSNYYTVTELESYIEQTSESILESVSAKYATIESTVSATETQYYQSTSATELVGGEWSSTAPEWVEGTYVWIRTVFYYGEQDDDGNYAVTTMSDPVCLTGSSGSSGKSIEDVTNYYALSDSADTEPTEWDTTPPTITSDERYLWNYEVISYTDGTTDETSKRVIGVYGEDGVGISSVVEYYAVSESSDTAPTSWSTDVPEITSVYRYLWNYEVTTYTDGSVITTEARVIGAYGESGADGEAGVGVSSVETYFATAYDNETAPEDGWSTTAPTTLYEINSDKTITYLWLWVKYLVTYTDGTTSYTDPFCMTDSAARSLVEEVVEANATLELCVKWLVDLDEDDDLYSYMSENGLDIISYINLSSNALVITSNRLTIESTYFSLDADGEITASAGKIGGWYIGTYSLYNKKSSYSSSTSGAYIGTDGINIGGSSTYFKVSSAGVLVATSVDLTGEITATSGTIGGWTIGSSSIYNTKSSYSSTTSGAYIGTDGINIGGSSTYFKVSSAGVLTCTSADISGTITATTLTATNVRINGNMATYSSSSASSPSGYIGYLTGSTDISTSTSGIGMVNYSYNTCHFIATTAGTRMNAGSASIFCQRSGATANVDAASFFIYSADIYMDNAKQIFFKNASATYVSCVGMDSSSQFFAGSTSYATYIRGSTIYMNGTAYSSSDSRLKNSIEYLPDSYASVLDAMVPVRFCYNSDDSGIYRLGYIAQDVQIAILDAGLSEYEAGLVSTDERSMLWLDYNQIVPLLHLKIKQQDTRIAELEERIDQLETVLAAV